MDRRNEEQLIRLTKLMLIVVLVLIIATCVQCEKDARAGVVTGEKHLAGIPVYLEQLKEPVYPEGIEILAQAMFHENWNTDKDHLAAYYTGAVVMNRVKRDDKWLHLRGEKTIYDVVYAKGQYSTIDKFYTTEIPEECYRLAIKVVKGTPDVPENVIFQAMFKQGSGVWKKVGTDYFCYE